MRFYVLEIGTFTQYKYAWFEATETAVYGDTPPRCPACEEPIGNLPWLPPYEVVLKQFRIVGDLVAGAGGSDFLASPRFLEAWQTEGLTGIDRYFEVTVVRMGTTTKSRGLLSPRLFGVDVVHTLARADYSAMGVVWSEPPADIHCRICGPASGGHSGIVRSIERIVLHADTWTGADIFYPVNLPGVKVLSQRAADCIRRQGFTNANVVPFENYSRDHGA